MNSFSYLFIVLVVSPAMLAARGVVCGFVSEPLSSTTTSSSTTTTTTMNSFSNIPTATFIPPYYINKSYKSNDRIGFRISQLFAQPNDDESPFSRVKFNDDGNNNNNNNNDNSLANPLDRFLTFLASDSVSIVSGAIGLFAVVIHRWNLVLASTSADMIAVDGVGDATAAAFAATAAAEALTYQTRTDLLAVFASGSVLLNGVTKLDVTTALAESVVLVGTTLSEPEQLVSSDRSSDDNNDDDDDNTLSWALESLLVATPAKTAILIDVDNNDQWTIRCRAGVVPSTSTSTTEVPEKRPILDRVGSSQNSKETYLPTLQALPGRTELTYLPTNTQMAVLIPIAASSSDNNNNNSNSKNSVLVLGGNTAKSFSPRDIAWSRIAAERIGEHL